MKPMVIQLTPEVRRQLRDALDSNAAEMTISYNEELRAGQLDQVQWGQNSVRSLYQVHCSLTRPRQRPNRSLGVITFVVNTLKRATGQDYAHGPR
jgi:hypothetical protein